MKIIVILSTLSVIVQGRPQYDYPKPSGNYGSPNGGNLNGKNGGNLFGTSGNGNGYADISNNGDFGNGYITGGTTLVHKHIYVHVPPSKLDEAPSKSRPIFVPPAEKHYKIIFIKAPTAPSPTAPVIPAPVQNEEKTLVYVLVKKPDDAPDIIIPTAAPTVPSKPEVYFIRYKNKESSDGGNGDGFSNGNGNGNGNGNNNGNGDGNDHGSGNGNGNDNSNGNIYGNGNGNGNSNGNDNDNGSGIGNGNDYSGSGNGFNGKSISFSDNGSFNGNGNSPSVPSSNYEIPQGFH